MHVKDQNKNDKAKRLDWSFNYRFVKNNLLNLFDLNFDIITIEFLKKKTKKLSIFILVLTVIVISIKGSTSSHKSKPSPQLVSCFQNL